MGMLRAMAAGGAKAYADTSNKNVDLHNEEVKARRASQEKEWLRQANQNWELSREQRAEARGDKEFERSSAASAKKAEADRQHQIQMSDRKFGQEKELQGSRQAAEKERALLNINKDKETTPNKGKYLENEVKAARADLSSFEKYERSQEAMMADPQQLAAEKAAKLKNLRSLERQHRDFVHQRERPGFVNPLGSNLQDLQ